MHRKDNAEVALSLTSAIGRCNNVCLISLEEQNSLEGKRQNLVKTTLSYTKIIVSSLIQA